MPQFDLGRVFTRVWEQFQRGFTKYLTVFFVGFLVQMAVFLVFGLGILLLVLGVGLTADSLDWKTIVATVPGLVLILLFIPVFLVVTIFINAVQLEVTSQLFAGYEPDLKVAYEWAKHRFVKYLSTSILAGLGIFAGFLLLIVPGIIFSLWWLLAGYLVAREDVGGGQALARSKALTGRALGWTFLVFVILSGFSTAFQVIPYIGFLFAIVIGLFWMPLLGALYEELRMIETGALAPSGQPEPIPPAPEPSVPESSLPSENMAEVVEVASEPTKPKKTTSKAKKKPVKRRVAKS